MNSNKHSKTKRKWQLDRSINISHIIGILGMGTATVSWLLVATTVGFKWSNEINLRIEQNEQRIEFHAQRQQESVARFMTMHEELKEHLWKIDEKLDRVAEKN